MNPVEDSAIRDEPKKGSLPPRIQAKNKRTSFDSLAIENVRTSLPTTNSEDIKIQIQYVLRTQRTPTTPHAPITNFHRETEFSRKTTLTFTLIYS